MEILDPVFTPNNHPKVFLKPGDVVAIEVEKICVLANTVQRAGQQ